MAFAVAVIAAILAGGLAYLNNRMTERRTQIREVDQVYDQAIQILSRMAETFPQHAEERGALRELLETQATRFTSQDLQLLQIALLEEIELKDLMRVRTQLERRKRSEKG